MAGSYLHCVDDDGKLLSNEDLVGMLENGGDVYEAVEELYGMIWYLAGTHHHGLMPGERVGNAQKNYKDGLNISPGVRE